MGKRTWTGLAALLGAAAVAVAGSVPASASVRGTAAAAAAQPAKAGDTGAGKADNDPVLAAAARKYGLTADRIDRALRQLKQQLAGRQAGGKERDVDLLAPAVVRLFARDLGVSPARGRAVLTFLLQEWKKAAPKPGAGDLDVIAVKILSAELHLSQRDAKTAWRELQALGDKGMISERNPQLRALARRLHVTPRRLLDVLVELKKVLAGQPKPGEPKPGDPKPGQPKPGQPKPGQPKPGQPKPGQPKPGQPGIGKSA